MEMMTVDGAVTMLGQVVTYQHTPGVAGSIFAMRWAGCGIAEKAFAMGFGLACALWVAPLIVGFVGMQTEAVPRAASLFCGAYGARLGDQIAAEVRKIDFGMLLRSGWTGLLAAWRSRKNG